MGTRAVIDGFARAAFFSLLPAFAVGGALGVPLLLCLAGAAAFRPSLLQRAFSDRPTALLLTFTLTGWVAASSLWSSAPEAPMQAAKIVIIMALGHMFVAAATHENGRRLTGAGGVAGFIVLAVLLCIEAIWDMPFNRAAQPDHVGGGLVRNVMRGAAVLMAMTWPTISALLTGGGPSRIGAALAAVAVSGFVATQFDQNANTLAFAVGLAAFAAAYAAPRIAIACVSAGLALWTLVAPFAVALLAPHVEHLRRVLPPSWDARVDIWSYVSARVAERPWLGHGLDAGRAPAHDAVPIHPHSASLHLWFDAGVIAAVLAAAALFFGGRWLSRRFADDRLGAAAACGTLTSLGIIANVSYGLWAEWWMATMLVAAALVGALAKQRS